MEHKSELQLRGTAEEARKIHIVWEVAVELMVALIIYIIYIEDSLTGYFEGLDA